MPFDRRLYPSNWEQIRARILARDEHRCACLGQCGDAHDGGRCNVPNHAVIVRDERNPAAWARHVGCSLCLGGDPECRSIKVVLTIAHYPDPTPSNCADENLRALCNRCHLLTDKAQHIRNTRITRMGRKAIGMLPGMGQ